MFKPVRIIGRKWNGNREGNTYHTAEIIGDDGSTIAKSGIHYGYGDQYVQTAWAMLQGMGHIPKGEPYGGTAPLREKYGVQCSGVYVSRKRDL